MGYKRFMIAASGLLTALGAGCGHAFYPDSLGLTLEELSKISTSDTLEPQEMRDELAARGIDETTINALLYSVRLANQYGGDLESAYNKLIGGELSSMTPDEVQLYGDATAVTTYGNDEAQAIVDFFEDYGIDTVAELEAWLKTNADYLPEDIDETNLRGVFIDTDTTDILNML